MSERPGDGPLDVDAAWAEIVAHWDVDGDDLRVVRAGQVPQHPAPEAPDDETDGETEDETEDETDDDVVDGPQDADEGDETSERAAQARGAGPPRPDRPRADLLPPDHGPAAVVPPTGPRVRPEPVPVPVTPPRSDATDPLLAALDEHFVPPEPPPLGGGDPLTSLAWLGALGGPLFLLVAALGWRDAPSLLIGVAVLAFVAGFVTLVVRMPDRDEDDDGAEV